MDTKDQVVQNMNFANTDFNALKDDMLALIPELTPEWTNANDTDLGVTLINVFCGIGDMLSYYLNEQARESYLPTARLRDTIINITNGIGYQLARPKSPSTDVQIAFSEPRNDVLTIYPYTTFSTREGGVTFVSSKEVTIRPTDMEITVPLLQGIPYDETFDGVGGDIQEYQLEGTNVGQDMMTVIVGEEGSGKERIFYELTRELYLRHGEDKSYFMVRTDGFNRTTIQFTKIYGDDVPKAGEVVTVRYLDSLGSKGRVIANMITECHAPDLPSDITIKQPLPARNGADRESKEKAVIQAPRELRTLWKAVTIEDYDTLFNGYPGVKKATAFDHESDRNISIHQVIVYIVPDDGGTMTPHFRQELEEFAARIKMVTTEVIILDADYVVIDVEAELFIAKGTSANKAITEAEKKLADVFGLGKSDFGQPVRYSNIISTIESVPGIRYTKMLKPSGDVSPLKHQIAYVGKPKLTLGGVV